MMKKKKFVICFAIVCLIVIVVGIMFYKNRKVDILYLDYGDNISNINLYKDDNEKTVLNDKDINLLFYLSDTCSPCLEELNLISQIDKLSILDTMTINLVWQDSIPETRLKKYGFRNVNNYTLKDKVKLYVKTPYFYMVKNNKVDFCTDDQNKIIDKLLKIVSDNDIKRSIFEELVGNTNSELNKSCILFLSENCDSCQSVEKIFTGKKTNFLNVKVISDYESESSIYDMYHIYSKIFGISKYPALVTFDGNKVDCTYEFENLH